MPKLPKARPYLFRVHRTIVGGMTVDVRLEPIRDDNVVHLTDGDEFITGTLHSDPFAPKPELDKD